ncbi:hypothetical protein D3C71_1493440 [compost metagenome]
MAQVIDVVVGEVPFFERAKAQIGAGQFVDGEARFNFHKHRRTFVPDTTVRGVAHAEEFRHVDVAIEVEPIFFGESFIFQVQIVVQLRSETGVVTAHHVNALVPPIRDVLAVFAISH